MVFGTWCAISSYSGQGGPDEFMATVSLIHRFVFQITTTLRWSPPSFSLDPSLVLGLPAYVQAYVSDVADMTASELYKASQAFSSLAAMIAFIKPLICAVPSLLTMDCAESLGEWLGASKNAAFAQEAPVGLIDSEELQTEEALASVQKPAGDKNKKSCFESSCCKRGEKQLEKNPGIGMV